MTYQSERKSQNVWSKRQWESSQEEIDRRKEIGTSQNTLTAMERISQAEQIARDEIIQSFQNETGYSRRSASIITRNKDPNEILKEVNKIKERQKALRR